MKARVKATGEVLEIASYATIPMEYCDSFGEPLRFSLDEVEILSDGNDLKESEDPDYWTRLEHQYAGQFMQAMISSSNYIDVSEEAMADASFRMAHALVAKYKKEEK